MSQRFELEGSEHDRPQGAADNGPTDPNRRVAVTVYVRPTPGARPPFDVAAEATKPPAQRRYLSAQEAADAYGASEEDLAAVRAFADAHELSIVRVNPAARHVKLEGTAATIGAAFGVELHDYREADHRRGYFSHEGPVRLPPELEGVVTGVFGLDTRRVGRAFHRQPPAELLDRIRSFAAARRDPQVIEAVGQPADTYLPPQVAQLYDFPAQPATGHTIAVFAFNGPTGDGASAPGGYDPTTLEDYFTSDLELPFPTITDVTVQGPGNDPGDGSDPDDSSPEVYLDLSIVGSLATGADIVVYFTEFTEQGWVDAITTAVSDTTNDPLVISISYGNPEDGAGTAWTSAAISQVNTALEQAASQGKTICCAAGDGGASDGEDSGLHVDFPASSPWVLGCGGTSLQASNGEITSETVWNDLSDGEGATGGGVSTVFTPAPTWQANVEAIPGTPLTGRGVPDVASLSDPETPFVVAQPGGTGGVGGTSAAAPLWASLLLLCGAALGAPVGYLNPLLYELPAGTLRDIVSGDNAAPGGDGYDAGPGWDACTGFGAPGGTTLLDALRSSGSAPSTS